MKKLFVALMACAAMISCSKSDVVFNDEQVEIGFSPVAHNITKAVAGVDTYGTTADATFPTDLNLYVFANAQNNDLTAEWPDTYFKNAKFIYSRLSNSVYEGETARFWPNVKSLVFAGYSNACNIDEIATNSTMDFTTNTLTITGYTQDNSKTAKGANDLMWFPWDTKSYVKQDAAVSATMKHACSWITVNVLSDGNYTDLKLKELTINGLYHTGTATCGASAATWAISGSAESEVLYSNEGQTVTTTATIFENVANNMVVIPQTPTTIDVTYSFVPQEGVDAITETKTGLSLQYATETVDDTTVSKKWESGKHYIYTITITATEILIAPTVEAWSDVTVTPNTTI